MKKFMLVLCALVCVSLFASSLCAQDVVVVQQRARYALIAPPAHVHVVVPPVVRYRLVEPVVVEDGAVVVPRYATPVRDFLFGPRVRVVRPRVVLVQ